MKMSPEIRLQEFADFCSCQTGNHPYLDGDTDAEEAQKTCAADIESVLEKLKAAKSILWMAKEYAEAGGNGPETREYEGVMKVLES